MEENSFWVGVGICEKLNPLGPQGDSQDEFSAQTHADRAAEDCDSLLLASSCKICRMNTAFPSTSLWRTLNHLVFHQVEREGWDSWIGQGKNTIRPESLRKSTLEDKQFSTIN